MGNLIVASTPVAKCRPILYCSPCCLCLHRCSDEGWGSLIISRFRVILKLQAIFKNVCFEYFVGHNPRKTQIPPTRRHWRDAARSRWIGFRGILRRSISTIWSSVPVDSRLKVDNSAYFHLPHEFDTISTNRRLLPTAATRWDFRQRSQVTMI